MFSFLHTLFKQMIFIHNYEIQWQNERSNVHIFFKQQHNLQYNHLLLHCKKTIPKFSFFDCIYIYIYFSISAKQFCLKQSVFEYSDNDHGTRLLVLYFP